MDNTEKSVLSVQIPTNTRLKTMSPMCHNDTWDSFVLLIKDFIVINLIP